MKITNVVGMGSKISIVKINRNGEDQPFGRDFFAKLRPVLKSFGVMADSGERSQAEKAITIPTYFTLEAGEGAVYTESVIVSVSPECPSSFKLAYAVAELDSCAYIFEDGFVALSSDAYQHPEWASNAIPVTCASASHLAELFEDQLSASLGDVLPDQGMLGMEHQELNASENSAMEIPPINTDRVLMYYEYFEEEDPNDLIFQLFKYIEGSIRSDDPKQPVKQIGSLRGTDLVLDCPGGKGFVAVSGSAEVTTWVHHVRSFCSIKSRNIAWKIDDRFLLIEGGGVCQLSACQESGDYHREEAGADPD